MNTTLNRCWRRRSTICLPTLSSATTFTRSVSRRVYKIAAEHIGGEGDRGPNPFERQVRMDPQDLLDCFASSELSENQLYFDPRSSEPGLPHQNSRIRCDPSVIHRGPDPPPSLQHSPLSRTRSSYAGPCPPDEIPGALVQASLGWRLANSGGLGLVPVLALRLGTEPVENIRSQASHAIC